jgi:hypothetical protein
VLVFAAGVVMVVIGDADDLLNWIGIGVVASVGLIFAGQLWGWMFGLNERRASILGFVAALLTVGVGLIVERSVVAAASAAAFVFLVQWTFAVRAEESKGPG